MRAADRLGNLQVCSSRTYGKSFFSYDQVVYTNAVIVDEKVCSNRARKGARCVVRWYARFGEELPWRRRPKETSCPYAVWVSEVMLQQTTVKVVARYYSKFMRTFPTVIDLAKARMHDVLALWEGLGYYRRAYNMHLCAQKVVEEYAGVWPMEEACLRALPGIGAYTAGAVRAIAFQKPAVALDTNVQRVVGRFIGVGDNTALVRKILQNLNWEGIAPGDFYQGLMDIGRLICGKRNILCEKCPLRNMCVWYGKGHKLEVLALAPKRIKLIKHACFFVYKRGEELYFCCGTQERKMLEGLWIFPSTLWLDEQRFQKERAQWPQSIVRQTCEPVLKHTFSHFTLYAYLARVDNEPLVASVTGKWIGQDIMTYPLSSLARKLLASQRQADDGF